MSYETALPLMVKQLVKQFHRTALPMKVSSNEFSTDEKENLFRTEKKFLNLFSKMFEYHLGNKVTEIRLNSYIKAYL